MKKAHRNFQIKPWMGCMGFLGFLGFLPKHGGGRNYLFFVFFAFFAWFFWGLLYKEPADERLVENETRAMRIVESFRPAMARAYKLAQANKAYSRFSFFISPRYTVFL